MMGTVPEPPPLEVYMLGLVDFLEVQQLQRRLVYELGETGGGALVLCEHPPTISIGRTGSRAHIVLDDVALRGMGVKVHYVNRGDGCVLHLPGQLAAYLALPLGPLGLNVQDHVDRLYATILATLDEFDLRGVLRADRHGVFIGQARVATVGVAVNRWIAYHGLTLNVGPYLELFEMLNEPGPGDGKAPLRQTSMEAQRQRQAPMAKVREAMLRHVEASFGLRQHHIYTNHPQVGRKALTYVYAPSSG